MMLRRGTAPAIALAALGFGVPAPAVARLMVHERRADAAMLVAGPPAYRGRTSQHQPISFTLGASRVRKLDFRIIIACPSRHRFWLRASGFSPITVRAGRFSDTVSSQHPSASATVTGRVAHGRVSGTLRLRRVVASEHAWCAGSATYTVRRSG